jgi:hypothetical protein
MYLVMTSFISWLISLLEKRTRIDLRRGVQATQGQQQVSVD